MCRHNFFQRNQKPGEVFDDFLTDLRKLGADCEFGDLKDSLIRDKIVSGIESTQLKDRLLREENMNLDKCIRICKAAELAGQQIQTLRSGEKIDAVHVNDKKNKKQRYPQQKSKASGPNSSTQSMANQEKSNNAQRQTSTQQENQRRGQQCSRCGYQHAPRNCPAYNKTCNICNKLNHFAKVCRNKKKLQVIESHDSDTEFILGKVTVTENVQKVNIVNKEWTEKVKFVDTGKTMVFKLDTGAGCNVIGKEELKKITKQRKLEKAKAKLTNYNGSNIKVLGKIQLCEI